MGTTTNAVRAGHEDQGVALRSRPGVLLIAATVASSTAIFLDASVVNLAVPAIGRDLQADVNTLQWIVTSYLVTVASFLLVAGSLSDRYGRRRLLLVGLVVIAVSAVLCAAAPSAALLIAGRVVQGIGGALVAPSSLALLNSTLQVADRARGIGVWAGLSTIGSTAGPYLGGWILDLSSWRWLFLINLPLVGAAILLLRRTPVDLTAATETGGDLPGVVLTVLGLGGVIYALSEGPAAGWPTPSVVVSGSIGVLAIGMLVMVERRARFPLLRLSLFSSRQFSAINAVTVLFYATISGASYLLVVQAQLRLGYSAAQAGALLIPGSVVFLVVSPLAGAAVARVGPRLLMSLGVLVVAAAVTWLSIVDVGVDYARTILPATLLWGLGLGLSVTPLTSAVLDSVTDGHVAEGSAVNNLASRIGGVLAIAAFPAVAGASGGRTLAEALASGYQLAMVLAAGLSVVASLIAALFVTGGRTKPPLFGAPPPHSCMAPGRETDVKVGRVSSG